MPRWTLLPLAVLLGAHIVVFCVGAGHAQLTRLGERLWDDYHLLRASVGIPQCEHADGPHPLQAQTRSDGSDDVFADLFGDSPDPDAAEASRQRQLRLCRERREQALEIQARVTGGVTVFRAVDHGMVALAGFGRMLSAPMLALILFLCAATATVQGAHIALRPARYRQEHRVAAAGELAGNVCLGLSSFEYLANAMHASAGPENPLIRWIFLAGFASLAVLSARRLFTRLPEASCGWTIGMAACVPLYSFMALFATVSLTLQRGDLAGPALFIDRMMEFPDIFTGLALYVVAGMLLRHSRIGELVFDVIRPWQLSSPALVSLVILLMAFPTAYTGASGVLVIALGATIYGELRTAGVRPQLALAATAMSGSCGVVLRPCLLVVMVAALNREVTTDQLFESGGRIVLCAVALFFLLSRLGGKAAVRQPRIRMAAASSSRACLRLLPHVAVIGSVIALFYLVLGTPLSEFSAPVVLPVAGVAVLLFERLVPAEGSPVHCAAPAKPANPSATGVEGVAGNSDAQRDDLAATLWLSAIHIGALLALIALSMATGGALESLDIVGSLAAGTALPLDPVLAMAALLAVLVMIGMLMEPYGAVILVSQTLAPLASQQDINPVHFWLLVLVAFELAYLSPPVAVNQLLARRAIGEDECRRVKAAVAGRSFWLRHESVLLPLVVLATTLFLVAYLPSAFV